MINLTKNEEIVFNLISKDNLSIKEIIKKKNVTRQAVYKTIKSLKEKGFLYDDYGCKNRNPFLTKDLNGNIAYADHCYFCDNIENLEKHHIIPKSKGGLDTNDNLILLCRKCHRKIHAHKFFIYFKNGYIMLVNSKDYLDIRLPNMRQLGNLRNPPKESINKAINKKKLFIGEKNE